MASHFSANAEATVPTEAQIQPDTAHSNLATLPVTTDICLYITKEGGQNK
jgi:hypothetical protein